jgi:hypothetical protein
MESKIYMTDKDISVVSEELAQQIYILNKEFIAQCE